MSDISHEHYLEESWPVFSTRDAAYMKDPSVFDDFLSAPPQLSSFEKIILKKRNQFSVEKRKLICDVLSDTIQSNRH